LLGALAWLEGKYDLALKRLDDAERAARESDHGLALFEAGRFRAHVYMAQGRSSAARAEKVRAVALADANGLHGRARRLRVELPFDQVRWQSISVGQSHTDQAVSRNPSSLLLGRHLDALLAVALASADQLDPARQARLVIDHLVRILGAERGFLFLRARGSDTLELAAGRGAVGEDLDQAAGYSRSVVEGVRHTHKPYVHSSSMDGLRDASDSVVAGDLRSIIAAPLLLNDNFLGVIYLDNHLVSGVFSEEDLSILSALSAHIAIAVETSRAAEDRRLFEARLRQQQKLESIGTLASGVAHEVNNPIQGIMSYAELIKRVANEPETVREFSAHITDECKRVATIIKNLLSLARTDEAKRTPENLFQIVHGSLSLFRVVLQNDQIQLEIDVPDDLPDMRCSGQQIQQVIMNLVTNARDAVNERHLSEDGHDTAKRIHVSARLTEHSGHAVIRLTVEDNGTGIDPLLVERIFDPFFTTKPQGQGTGLGLWICHRIVFEQGGTLSLESEVGQYARFHVELPVDV
jgi:signal transduction histidine kinase